MEAQVSNPLTLKASVTSFYYDMMDGLNMRVALRPHLLMHTGRLIDDLCAEGVLVKQTSDMTFNKGDTH